MLIFIASGQGMRHDESSGFAPTPGESPRLLFIQWSDEMGKPKKDTCPCGSGAIFEECCGRKIMTPAKLKAISIWGGILVVTGIITVVAISSANQKTDSLTVPSFLADGQTPGPYQYFPITNQYWDPRPGHEHMHAGLPPNDPTAPVQDTGLGDTHDPYEYDAINDRHWDPAHNHWHDGLPPGNQ
ncbi:MAG: SEC-C metal-binding domain-containing protein [Planctomycetota bacterium]|nr:SEC-C metal-binding domain-containing protein [Planctomycetota bacterium]